MDQQAFHHHEQLQLQQAIIEAIAASATRPLTPDERSLLAMAAGVTIDQSKEVTQ